MKGKQIVVTFNTEDTEFLEQVAEDLKISSSEVIRRGLRLMSIYAETKPNDERKPKEPKPILILKDGDEEKTIMVI